MLHMLKKVGWKADVIDNRCPVLPISGWMGDNLLVKSEKMGWWKGVDVKLREGDEVIHIDTLVDALEKWVKPPTRDSTGKMRVPLSGVYKIKGVGDVLTGRVEQGSVKPGDECMFLPTHSQSTPCTGKIFTVEMHHKNVPEANQGDNVGMNVKALPKDNMPRVGDIMVLKTDNSITRTKAFTAQVQVLNHPGELKAGYCPIAFVRTARSAVKMTSIDWKMGKSTGGTKAEKPTSIKAGEMGQCVFEPQQAFVVDSFKVCEGLGRVAIMEGNSVVMLGKVSKVEGWVEAKK
jgi:elongation factor 1-alpha